MGLIFFEVYGSVEVSVRPFVQVTLNEELHIVSTAKGVWHFLDYMSS